MTKKQQSKGKQKKFAEKRTANPPRGNARRTADQQTGEGFQQQDPKRRLGNFQTAGEHARTGTRNK